MTTHTIMVLMMMSTLLKVIFCTNEIFLAIAKIFETLTLHVQSAPGKWWIIWKKSVYFSNNFTHVQLRTIKPPSASRRASIWFQKWLHNGILLFKLTIMCWWGSSSRPWYNMVACWSPYWKYPRYRYRYIQISTARWPPVRSELIGKVLSQPLLGYK